MGTYAYSGSPIFLTVATGGMYNITAYGGSGGNGENTSGTVFAGGAGGKEAATVSLTTGEHLEIIVGGAGTSAAATDHMRLVLDDHAEADGLAGGGHGRWRARGGLG